MRDMVALALAMDCWFAHWRLGRVYYFGGDDPMQGLDCSGLMIEGLKTGGILPRAGDWTAHSLAGMFPRVLSTEALEPGMMLFWDWDGDGVLDHVEVVSDVAQDGRVWTIGAAGGKSTTKTLEEAIRLNAFTMKRPARPHWKVAVDPFRKEAA